MGHRTCFKDWSLKTDTSQFDDGEQFCHSDEKEISPGAFQHLMKHRHHSKECANRKREKYNIKNKWKWLDLIFSQGYIRLARSYFISLWRGLRCEVEEELSWITMWE